MGGARLHIHQCVAYWLDLLCALLYCVVVVKVSRHIETGCMALSLMINALVKDDTTHAISLLTLLLAKASSHSSLLQLQ